MHYVLYISCIFILFNCAFIASMNRCDESLTQTFPQSNVLRLICTVYNGTCKLNKLVSSKNLKNVEKNTSSCRINFQQIHNHLLIIDCTLVVVTKYNCMNK